MIQDTINTDPAPKVFLQNKYSRAQTKLIEAKGVVDTKRECNIRYNELC